jgi:hypothetical protein
MGKTFYKSRTFWFNLAAGVLALCWGDVKPYVSPEMAGAVVAIGNMVLRYITSEPIVLK